MDVVANNYIPGDSRLIDQIVYELKSQGIFDNFRKDCISDVDTKPAYQNLRQRVEGCVSGFLKDQGWRSDLNKNQIREQLRKNIYDAGFLEIGLERIVDQVVNPKINSIFLPKIEEVVYGYLGLQKPVRPPPKKELSINVFDLLPKDLEAISPESDHGDRRDSPDNLDEARTSTTPDIKNENSQTKGDELMVIESTSFIPPEEISADSNLSGFSGLQSHESCHSSSDFTATQIEQLSNQEPVLTQTSSTIQSCDDVSMESTQEEPKDPPKPDETKPEVFSEENTSETVENVKQTEEVDENKKQETEVKKMNVDKDNNEKIERTKSESSSSGKKEKDKHKSHKSSSHDKDRKNSSKSKDRASVSKDRDSKIRAKDSSSRDRDKDNSSKDKDKDSSSRDKDKDNSSRDKDIVSRDKDRETSGRDKDIVSREKDKDNNSRDKDIVGKDKDKDNSSRDKDKDNSSRDKDKDSGNRDKDNSSRDKVRDKNKEKDSNKEGRSSSSSIKKEDKTKKHESSSHKSKDKSDRPKESSKSEKDSKEKDSKSKEKEKSKSKHSSGSKTNTHKKEHSSSSSNKEKISKSHSSSKSSSSNSNNNKKSSSESKSKSLNNNNEEHKKNHVHSSSSNHSKKHKDRKSSDDHYSAKEKKTDRRSTDRDSNDGSSSTNRNNSSKDTYTTASSKRDHKEILKNSDSGSSGDSGNSDNLENKSDPKANSPQIKYIKPKFASNIHEARKLMKIRKQLAKLERQNQLSLSSTENETINIEEAGAISKEIQINIVPTLIPSEMPKDVRKSVSPTKLSDKQNDGDSENVFKGTDMSTECWEAFEKRLALEMSQVNNSYSYPDDDCEDIEMTQNLAVFSPIKEKSCVTNQFEYKKQTIVENECPKSAEIQKISVQVDVIRESSISCDEELNKGSELVVNGEMESPEIPECTNGNCAYLEKQLPRVVSDLLYLNSFIGKMEEDIEKQKSKVHTGVPKMNILEVRLERKRKLEEAIQINIPQMDQSREPGGNVSFPLPLSPAESDKSCDAVKEAPGAIPEKRRRGSQNVAKASVAKRYSTEDLYKPRPVFSTSRRRGIKN